MKILNLWMVALMALSFSFTFVSCSDDNDDTDNTEQAKAIAGTYKGYSIGESRMFSDYLMTMPAQQLPPIQMVPSIWFINQDPEILS